MKIIINCTHETWDPAIFMGGNPIHAILRCYLFLRSWSYRLTHFLCRRTLSLQFLTDRKDTEGWETVQRGRTTRSRSAAMAVNVTNTSGTMYLSLKDDSDKENGLSVTQNGELEFEQTSPSSDSVTDTPEKLKNQNEDTSIGSFKVCYVTVKHSLTVLYVDSEF